jgi:hypothetical protein
MKNKKFLLVFVCFFVKLDYRQKDRQTSEPDKYIIHNGNKRKIGITIS